MRCSRLYASFFSLVAALCGSALPARAQLTVVSVSPPIKAIAVVPNTAISIDFDRALDPSSVPPAANNAYVFGGYSGAAAGTWSLQNGNQTLRFVPARPFVANDVVIVGLTHDLRAGDLTHLRSAGFVWQFTVKTEPAPMSFTTHAILSARTDPGTQVTLYGANASDFNGDDYVDLAAINESSSDLRVFLNKADASGDYLPFLTPVNPTGSVPSPNAAGDFNRDGKTDVITCDVGGSSITVLLGNGDGTFQPGVTYAMGAAPHGIAVFDANGDGAWDVATANTGSNDVAVRLNNGDGTFGPPIFFDGGGNYEYSMIAADMNNDGIFDLIVGAQGSQTLIVHLGNGDGTFTALPPQPAGGLTWMIRAGDVNGDGKMDISSANSFSDSGSILLGDGMGGLGAPQVLPAASAAVATDLGDLDGDGDLDWVVSCFSTGLWYVFKNDGTGVFTFDQTLSATSNSSCAMLVDIDNDRDLDIVGSDETADEMTLFENGSLDALTFCYGTASACPCANAGLPGHGCEHSFGIGGGLLNARGRASVAADTLSLDASGLPPATLALFFQGTTSQIGVITGDGVLCAGGTLLRVGSRNTTNGMAVLGWASGNTPLHTKGQIPSVGGTRTYQTWYRNSAAFCTSETFNLTNALQVTWTP